MYLTVLLISIALFSGQLLAGTNPEVAALLTFSICCGLCAIAIAGGFRSPAGFLNAILTAKFLVFGVVIKILSLEPADNTLRAPLRTSLVMAAGFFSLMIATAIQRHLPTRRNTLIPGISEPKIYLALTLVFLVIGYGGYFVALASDFGGGDIQTGGILGVARGFSGFSSMAVVPALFYAWASRSERFMTHPLALGVLAIGVIIGLVTTSKEGAMEPPVFYLLTSACRYGFRDKRIWALTGSGLLYYSLIVYPYAQYVRHNGGREGNLAQRIGAMKEAMVLTITDPDFRESVDAKLNATESSYFESERLHPFTRLAMIGEADRLIDGTGNQFTGWETIVWSLKLMVPSFIFPEKPIFGPGNYFAHIANDVNPEDMTTQVAYGSMAGLFNAFSYPGVLFGSTLLFTLFYYSFRFWFGDPRWSASPNGSSLWFIVLIATFQHSIVEDQIAGLLTGMIIVPLQILVFYGAAKVLTSFLAPHQADPANQACLT